LECCACGKDLLSSPGVAVYLRERTAAGTEGDIFDFYWACKGRCDEEMRRRVGRPYNDSWMDIEDLRIPFMFVRFVSVTLNRMRAGLDVYSDTAFEREKEFIIRLSQSVVRETTDEEWERLERL